jgi:hypothetical protein
MIDKKLPQLNPCCAALLVLLLRQPVRKVSEGFRNAIALDGVLPYEARPDYGCCWRRGGRALDLISFGTGGLGAGAGRCRGLRLPRPAPVKEVHPDRRLGALPIAPDQSAQAPRPGALVSAFLALEAGADCGRVSLADGAVRIQGDQGPRMGRRRVELTRAHKIHWQESDETTIIARTA